MTYNEAHERATRIWPGLKFELSHGYSFNGMPGKVQWWVYPVHSAPDHSLDINGHPLCHEECKKREVELTTS